MKHWKDQKICKLNKLDQVWFKTQETAIKLGSVLLDHSFREKSANIKWKLKDSNS